MLKKILLSFAIVANSLCHAQTIVPIVWPFNPGSTQSNYIRAIIEDANVQQSEYRFVFDSKPGAGGAIAMNHALKNTLLTIVSNSSSFFTRPLFFPNESYDVSKFVPIITQMTGQPIAIHSKKFSSIVDLKKQARLTIGIIPGSVTQLVAETLIKTLPGVEVTMIPYKGTPDITVDVLGDRLDLGIEFPNDLQSWVNNKSTNVIGVTGKMSHPGFKTFNSQGIVEFDDITVSYFFLIPADINEKTRNDLHSILRQSNKNQKVVDLYRRDFSIPADHSLDQSNKLYSQLGGFWKKIIVK